MSSECGEFPRTTSNFCIDTHTEERCTPKRTSYPFIWTQSTPASFCVKTRAGIQKTCTDGASSLPPLPSRPFKSNTGLRHRGSWVLPPSHPLTLPLFLSLPPPPACSWQGRCQETGCAAPPENWSDFNTAVLWLTENTAQVNSNLKHHTCR